jgi:dienelactone hydrolase
VHVEEISYEVDDVVMVGLLAFDDYLEGSRPAVLVAHEGPGIDEHVKGRAQRLASLGYCAFALDYLGGGTALYDQEPMMARLTPLMADPAATRRRGFAGLDVLLACPQADPTKVAVIGYCFGGTMALELARAGADIKAVVGFHPGLSSSTDSTNITGSVLVCIGSDDPFTPREARLAFEDEMRDAGVTDWTLEVYGGVGHSFTNIRAGSMGRPGIGYHAASDRRSWRSMLHLFEDTIGPPR